MCMNAKTTRTENETLANAYSLISAQPGIDRARLAQSANVGGRAWWAVEQLLARGMIVALQGDGGRGTCEVRYATVRAARAM